MGYFFCAIDGGVSSLGTFQAHWRGVSLRRRLAAALAAVTWLPDLEEEEEELLEELDTEGFILDEVCACMSLCRLEWIRLDYTVTATKKALLN